MTTDVQLLIAQPTAADTLDEFPFDWPVDDPGAQFLRYADGTVVPPTLTTSVRGFWNDESLFIRMSGVFQRLRIMHPPRQDDLRAKTRGLWKQSDVFEAFLGVDAASTGRYFEFQFGPDGRWNDLAIDAVGTFQADEHWASGLQVKAHVDTDQCIWRAVIQIPWIAFGTGPATLEGNFYRASGAYHGDELLAWSPTGYGERCFHRPARFGRVALTG
jgi:hypothetical protein